MHKILLAMALFVTMLYAQAEQTDQTEQIQKEESIQSPQINEAAIVRSIIEKSGIKNITVQDITEKENGRIVTLDLSNRDFSKDGISILPAEIGQLSSLETLLCQENIITVIPARIGNLKSLKKFVATSNRINSVPAEIGKCSSLVDLDLRHNQIETLPQEIGNLENLVYLRLWGNKLTSLPETIGNMKSLNELYLKDNRLTSLPLNLTKLQLEYVDVIGNKLCNLSPRIEAWILKIDKKYKQTQKCW